MIPRQIPSLNWLRVFAAAAGTGSFARAGKLLNISPPAVSQQIRALEAHLAQPLFERHARSVELTEAGRAFLPVVANALSSVEATANDLFGNKKGETLVVQVSLMLAASWFSERVHAFLKAHPKVSLNLTTGANHEDFRRRRTDFMITFGQPPDQGEDGDRLFGERLFPVARPDIAGQISEPSDLTKWPLIEISTHRANWWRLLPGNLDANRWPRFVYCDTTVAALALAKAGAGIALARAPASDVLINALGLVRCLPQLEAVGDEYYYLVYPSLERLSPVARELRNWLLKEVT
jgi:LysR family glycine cleavage system transcriptional activator